MLDREPRNGGQDLRAQSQRVRADAIRLRILATATFCRIAERQAKWESAEAARQTLAKAWHRIEEIDRHIREPNHVTRESAAMLQELLWTLEERAAQIEAKLDRPNIEQK